MRSAPATAGPPWQLASGLIPGSGAAGGSGCAVTSEMRFQAGLVVACRPCQQTAVADPGQARHARPQPDAAPRDVEVEDRTAGAAAVGCPDVGGDDSENDSANAGHPHGPAAQPAVRARQARTRRRRSGRRGRLAQRGRAVGGGWERRPAPTRPTRSMAASVCESVIHTVMTSWRANSGHFACLGHRSTGGCGARAARCGGLERVEVEPATAIGYFSTNARSIT